MNQPCLPVLAAALAFAAAALAGAGAARAQTASTPLSGVTVAAPSPVLPKVVSTYPEAGKAIPPGAVILKVTFDQKMNPDGWDFGKGQDRYPQCLDRPRLLSDEKTFILLCTVGGAGHFSVSFNGTAAGGFVNLAGQRATPSTLDFATTDDPSVSTIADAMKAAGLKADEGPVMEAQATPDPDKPRPTPSP
jgi:hypothetical protein